MLVASNASNTSADPQAKRIVAVDLQAMQPIPGALCIQGDISRRSTAIQIVESLGGQLAEIVVCDGKRTLFCTVWSDLPATACMLNRYAAD